MNPKSRMLVGDNIVFVFRVQRLVLWCDGDFFCGQLDACEVFEEVGVVGGVEVDVGEGGVAGLGGVGLAEVVTRMGGGSYHDYC